MTAIQVFSIPKPQVYETAKIRLTSPILHIGSQISKLNPYEYIQTGNKVYLPDQEALARGLYQRGKLNDYIRIFEKREDITPLLKQTFGSDWSKIENDEGQPIFPKIAISDKWVDGKISDLRPMIRNGFNQLYIPGSSIKGAIRTAIVYHLLKYSTRYKTPTTISAIEKKLREKLDDHILKREAKRVSNQLFMEKLLTDFSLYYQGKLYRASNIQNTDFMRAINISDSEPLVKRKIINPNAGKETIHNIPVTTEVIVSSHFNDGNAKYKASLYVEMVHQVRTEFTITLDTEMLSWFCHNQGMIIPFKNIQDIINICQEFAQDQWDGEYDYWSMIKNKNHNNHNLNFDLIRDFYKQEECLYQLRLGWGSGFCGTTINWLVNDDLRAEIRDTCGIAAPNFEAPKSRRTIKDQDGDIRYVPGWVKLKITS
jgi:CRISPR-associated protein Csm5